MRTPLEILMQEHCPALLAEVEQQVAKIEQVPAIKRLRELATPNYGDDPNELIAHRFLYRAAVALLLGPTGIGKSSLVMQLAIHLAVGRALFGIVPGAHYAERGMRILMVQAENDEGDLAEMRDGVVKGCDDLSDEEKSQALDRIRVVTVCDRSAERFVELLDHYIEQEGPFEIVIVDPAFAYLGGDSNSQADVSRFMRELINPLLHKHSVGMILAHHVNKPLRGKEKDGWAAGDFAYLGAGSAEWINPARAALAIRSLGSDRVFELRAAKRGRRLRWEDGDGNPTTHRYIAHHDEPGVICWRVATEAEVEEVLSPPQVTGRPRKCNIIEVLHCIRRKPGQNQAYYKMRVSGTLGCSETAAHNAIVEGVGEGVLREEKRGLQKVYSLTEEGQQRAQAAPSAVDWGKQ